MDTPPAPKPSGKSPLTALLISIVVPGLGHIYCGAALRGILIMCGLYAATAFLAAAGSAFAFFGMPILIGLTARDAWRRARIEAAKESAELALGAPPRPWLVWTWVACRALWITVFPLIFGAVMLLGAAGVARRGMALQALPAALPAFVALFLAWTAARHTWDVLHGTQAETESALKSEITTTAGVFAICLVLFAIAAPAFSGLFRKSAEGAMKGNLGLMRQEVERYRREHGGRAPDSLEALVAAGALKTITPVWPRFAGTPHSKTSATTIVPEALASDSGKWAYVVSPSSPGLSGTLFIDCTHTDSRGSVWSSY